MQGSIAKFKAATYFMELGYDVFMEMDGKSPFDLVLHKEGKLERVEVKSTRRRSKYETGWEVQIKKVRPNRTRNNIKPFDNSECDKLVIYVVPLDEILVYEAQDIKVKNTLTILDKDIG